MNTKPKNRKDFTEGPLFFNITLFAIPIMLTGLLQIAYSMADNIVVGKFSGDSLALAAVGCTGTLNAMVINLIIGIAGGTGIVVSQLCGAGDKKQLSECVHTAMTFSVIGGIVFAVIGVLVSRPALMLLGTKPEILDRAVLYFRIICIGIPANVVYNFGSGILRGAGNSRAPLVILGLSGLCNVGLNLVFVIACKMTVDGVATATVISQYISAIAVVALLVLNRNEPYAVSFSRMGIKKRMLAKLIRIGLPLGVQSMLFSIANMTLTAAVNTFPTEAVTANTIAGNIDAITWTAITCFTQSCMTFTGQNCGAKRPDRVKKVLIYSMIQTTVAAILVAASELLLAEQLISLYINNSDPNKAEIMMYAKEIMTLMLTSYFIFGVLDSLTSSMKGLGYSAASMVITLSCICGVRVLWILTVFPRLGTVFGLYISYPLTWTIAIIVTVIVYRRCYKKFKRSVYSEERAETGVPVNACSPLRRTRN